MRVLLDTHTLLWFALNDARLSSDASSLITKIDNTMVVSPASYWEIAIKISTDKYSLSQPYEDFMRYVFKAAEVPAGEAIVFTYGQQVELDGQDGLSNGRAALLEKEKGNYRLRDYSERGEIEDLGLRDEDDPGGSVPLIDTLHRTLWMMENQPRRLHEYLDEAMPNRQQLRLLANTLAGPGLSGKSDTDRERLLATTSDEQSALGKLLANWKALVPESLFEKK